jgi:chorismate dehydratase
VSAPATWRIGCVPYLNARPLIYGIEQKVTFAVPSRLADWLYGGRLDVAMVPVAEVLLHDRYDVLDGICIGGCGPVRSVLLAHRLPLEKIRRVAVDTASRTSAWLVRVILQCGYHVEPEFYPRPGGAKLSDHEAMLLIGDEAIWYVTRGVEPRAGILDLGQAWTEMTGLPFVFAVWAGRRGVFDGDGDGAALRRLLREAKAAGLANIERIVQGSTEATPEFRREYLMRNVCYELGEAEKRGICRFQRYVKELGLVTRCHDLRYIG